MVLQVIYYYHTIDFGAVFWFGKPFITDVIFYLPTVPWIRFYLVLHQCNMNVYLKLFWGWMSFAKLNLGWERLQFLFFQPCSKLSQTRAKLLHLFYVIPESQLIRYIQVLLSLSGAPVIYIYHIIDSYTFPHFCYSHLTDLP